MRLGELLKMNGLISEEALAETLEAQARTQPRRKLGQLLAEQGLITERQLLEALEFQLGVPCIDLSESKPDVSVLSLLPSRIAREYEVLPLERSGGKLKAAMTDPLNQEAINAVQTATGFSVQPLLAAGAELKEAILRYYGADESAAAIEGILQAAAEGKAKAIHFEPQESGLVVRFRMGESMRVHQTFPRTEQSELLNRIRDIARMPATRRETPQFSQFPLQIAYKPYDVSASCVPSAFGDHYVFRLAEPPDAMLRLTELGLTESHLAQVEKAIQAPGGLVIVSGPPRSGTTTTLYALLHRLAAAESKCALSVEDPVVRRLVGVTQLAIDENAGFTFAKAIRSALRHDADVLMVGELRDSEVLEAAVRAAMKGCSVLGGLQGGNAVNTLSRLMALSPDAEFLASSLKCIVSQRLVKRLCKQCAQTASATEEEEKLFEKHEIAAEEAKKNDKGLVGNFRSFVSSQINGKLVLGRPSACRHCGESGYRGEVAAFEVLTVTDTLREMIVERRPLAELEKHIVQTGHKSIIHNALLKARDGLTTADEAKKLSMRLAART